MPCHPFVEQEKSPGRLPRPVRVKNLTPQEKVKEWIQILPPTKTATSKAILTINSDEHSNASPNGNPSEAGT